MEACDFRTSADHGAVGLTCQASLTLARLEANQDHLCGQVSDRGSAKARWFVVHTWDLFGYLWFGLKKPEPNWPDVNKPLDSEQNSVIHCLFFHHILFFNFTWHSRLNSPWILLQLSGPLESVFKEEAELNLCIQFKQTSREQKSEQSFPPGGWR